MCRKNKIKKSKDEKKLRRKKRLRVVVIILLMFNMFFLTGAIVTKVGNKSLTEFAQQSRAVDYGADTQLKPTKIDGNWTFTTDEDFKIMQLTDIHIGAGFLSHGKDRLALSAVINMVTEEKPDLVIITGDMAYPVPFQAGTFDNWASAKILADTMESLGVYWTFALGNHDTEAYSYYNRSKLCELYLSQGYEYLLFQRGPTDIDGYGNQIINIQDSDSITTQSLVILDSHSYTDGDFLGLLWKYDNIKESQLEWYTQQIEKIGSDNVKKINALNKTEERKSELHTMYDNPKSLAFFHIPLAEYQDAWDAVWDKETETIVNTADAILKYGIMGEKAVFSGTYDDEVFETFLEVGSTQGVFVGHDHYNNFSIEYKGIRLTYGYSIDYLAYPGIIKMGSQRGCTMIQVENDGTFDCEAKNYYDEANNYNPVDKDDVTMQEMKPVV